MFDLTEIADLLDGVQLVLATPERWTQFSASEPVRLHPDDTANPQASGFCARTAEGYHTRPDDPRAVRWCLLGALLRAQADIWATQQSFTGASWLLSSLCHGLTRFNDRPATTHADILKLLGAAKERLSQPDFAFPPWLGANTKAL